MPSKDKELSVGKKKEPFNIVKSLKKWFTSLPKKTRKFLKKYWILSIPILVFAGLFYWYILRDLPSPTKLTSTSANPQSTQIFDRNGVLLYTIYNKKNQKFLPLQDIPIKLQEATISIEDRDFYKHGAVDFRGLARAFVSTVFRQQTQGGSTITQQLVKNSLLTSERTVVRKIREAILAFATELLYPKTKILELYLNQIPYGGTTYGIEAASETYFGKPAKNLTLAQAALLAGLPEAPTTFSPFGSHPELAKERQLLVLQAMKDQGYISAKEQQEADNEPLRYQQVADVIKAPHFSLYVKDLLIKQYGEKTVEEGGLSVTTSLDLGLENFAQDAIATEMANLKFGAHVTNGAAMITDPATGEILAMVGSRDYFNTTDTDGNVNVTIMHRQPGSSIKPINYAVGLIHGFTAATPFIDEPTCFPNPGHDPYCPLNYDLKWHGVQPMRFSLANSFNIPAVKMLKANGIESMIATASAMGITTLTDPDRYGLSLTLGGGEVTMVDMMTAYGVFANGGYQIPLHPILKVTDHSGRLLEEYSPPPSPIFGKRVLPPGVAFIISSILSDNGARSSEFGTNSQLYIPKKTVSAKTGTTNDFRDNWTFGYTPSFVVGAWVGNNDNSAMGNLASGITGAAPIWNAIMVHLIKDRPDEPLQQPANVIQKAVCAGTGLLPPAPPNSCQTRFEYFISGTEPKKAETMENVLVDKSTQDLAKPGQTDNVETKGEIIVTDPVGDRYCLTCNHPVTPTPTP